MIRKVLNGVLDTIVSPPESIIWPGTFTKKENCIYEWLRDLTPCFPLVAKDVAVLTEPEQFYNTLLRSCQCAKERVTLASLYLGTGKLEEKIVSALKNNKSFKSKKLKVNVLLDYTRASRSEINSRSMLLPLLQSNEMNCQVSLYHTPVLRGLLKKYTPNRWNELFGLQHMKLYIFDDVLIISGANLSNDYFTNRQDRYFVIKDRKLSDFYCGLVERVQTFSLKLDKNDNVGLSEKWEYSPYEGDKEKFVCKASSIIEQYLNETTSQQNRNCKDDSFDTWIYPMVQMGQLGIEQDAKITEKILADASGSSRLKIGTGYFNLTSQYVHKLVEESKAHCDVLMAHPEVLPPNSDRPTMTLIGSPNFGERSVKRDLETQIVVVTENENLRNRLHEECGKLFEQGIPAEVDRDVPHWVRLFVLFFRNYF